MDMNALTNLFTRTLNALNNDDIDTYQSGMVALDNFTDRFIVSDYTARKAKLMFDMLIKYADILDEEDADRKWREDTNGDTEYRMPW